MLTASVDVQVDGNLVQQRGFSCQLEGSTAVVMRTRQLAALACTVLHWRSSLLDALNCCALRLIYAIVCFRSLCHLSIVVIFPFLQFHNRRRLLDALIELCNVTMMHRCNISRHPKLASRLGTEVPQMTMSTVAQGPQHDSI